jgi:formylglycine-generating enzyme required for sulfatase activity
MNFLPLPPGSFWMGASDADKFVNDTERPRHLVTLASGLSLAIDPVTNAEFRSFAPDHAPAEPGDWPATGVSWHEANEFATWFSGASRTACRLPSEAEWECACRAGSVAMFSWGDELSPSHANYLYSEQGERVGSGSKTSVGRYPANAFGYRDLHGNVCEWVADRWHATYHDAPTDGSPWRQGEQSLRVIRGGAWDYMPRLLRCGWRDALDETVRRDNLGFRLVREK